MENIMLEDITKILLVTTGVVWAVYDIIPFLSKERGDTISEVISKFGKKYITIPFMFGVLMGHFFWTSDADPKPLILVLVIALIVLFDFINNKYFSKEVSIPSIVIMMVGIPVGHYFWALN
jgi:hypothetical protein